MDDIKYYSYNNDDGIEEFETEEQAKAAADDLMSCRDELDEDGEIEYGVMIPLGRLIKTNRRDTPESQEEADDWERNKWAYVCDHEIVTVTTLNHRLANEFVKLRAANMSLDAQLAEANRTIEALRNESAKFKLALCRLIRATVAHNSRTSKHISSDDMAAIDTAIRKATDAL